MTERPPRRGGAQRCWRRPTPPPSAPHVFLCCRPRRRAPGLDFFMTGDAGADEVDGADGADGASGGAGARSCWICRSAFVCLRSASAASRSRRSYSDSSRTPSSSPLSVTTLALSSSTSAPVDAAVSGRARCRCTSCGSSLCWAQLDLHRVQHLAQQFLLQLRFAELLEWLLQLVIEARRIDKLARPLKPVCFGSSLDAPPGHQDSVELVPCFTACGPCPEAPSTPPPHRTCHSGNGAPSVVFAHVSLSSSRMSVLCRRAAISSGEKAPPRLLGVCQVQKNGSRASSTCRDPDRARPARQRAPCHGDTAASSRGGCSAVRRASRGAAGAC